MTDLELCGLLRRRHQAEFNRRVYYNAWQGRYSARKIVARALMWYQRAMGAHTL